MQKLIIPIYPDLVEQGSTVVLKGTLPEKEYSVGLDTYTLPEGVTYDIVLTNTGGAVLLTGMAYAKAIGECARCLEPASFDIAGDVEGYYLMKHDGKPSGDLEEDEYDYVSDDDTIDVSDAISAALVLETPLVILCSDDCKGLCPQCGANLNEGPCGCKPEREVSDNPFSVLASYGFDSDTESDASSGDDASESGDISPSAE